MPFAWPSDMSRIPSRASLATDGSVEVYSQQPPHPKMSSWVPVRSNVIVSSEMR